MHQLDIKIAFLNGELQEEFYVTQPAGFAKPRQEHQVCCLKKALYGLKQAPRAWYQKIHTYLTCKNFKNSSIESTMYLLKDGDDLLIVILYVDDMFITSTNEEQTKASIAKLNSAFDMLSLGLLHYFLGMEFEQCDDGIVIKQEKYIESLPKQFNMEDCKPISTPAEPGVKLSLHNQGESFDTTL